MAGLPELVADGIELFRGEGAFAHAGAVGLYHTDHFVDFLRSHARPDGNAAGNRVGGGDIGIGAVIDVQHGRLCPLEKDPASGSHFLVQEGNGVADIGANALCISQVFLENSFIVQRLMVIKHLEFLVFLGEVRLELPGEFLLVHEVADADADAVVPVHVAGADAALRRPNLRFPARLVTDAVHNAVIRKHHMGTVGKTDTRDINASFFHGIHFL